MNSEYSNILNVTLRPLSRSIAKSLIEKNHYTHSLPSTVRKYALGVFYNGNDEHTFFDTNEILIGCIAYSTPVGFRSASSIAEGLDQHNTLELVRLWIADGYGKNIESYVIGQSFRWLKKNASHIKALVSYADPEQGHNGIIYQATNWLYQGTGTYNFVPYYYKLTKNEDWRHSRNTEVGATTLSAEKMYDSLGHGYWRKQQPRKHKYIYFLCNKKERKMFLKSLKHPLLPYPDRDGAQICDVEYVDRVNGKLTITKVEL